MENKNKKNVKILISSFQGLLCKSLIFLRQLFSIKTRSIYIYILRGTCIGTRFVDPTFIFFYFFNSLLLWDVFIINRVEEGFCVFRNELTVSISDWVFGNVWSCSTLQFIMKTSHKSNELKNLKKRGGLQIGYLWVRADRHFWLIARGGEGH